MIPVQFDILSTSLSLHFGHDFDTATAAIAGSSGGPIALNKLALSVITVYLKKLIGICKVIILPVQVAQL